MDRQPIHNVQQSIRNRRFQRWLFLGAKSSPKVPAIASVPAGIHGGPKGRSLLSAVVAAVVVTVNVLDTGELPEGVTLEGVNVQAAIPGSVPQENFTVPE